MSTLTDTLFFENNICETENGAVTYKSSGSELVDQFAKAGSYMGRPIDYVFEDQKRLWEYDPEAALRFPFYLRLITRKARLSKNETCKTVQKGQGNRDEALKRILWIAKEHPNTFYESIWMLPIIGSWKDLWTLMCMDMDFKEHLIDRRIIYYMITHGLLGKSTGDLCRKYMPRIRSLKKCVTQRAKNLNLFAVEFAKMYAMTAREYNKIKAAGSAHEFQKLMCSRQYDKLQWGSIPGKALSNIVFGNFLERHNLYDSYKEWVMTQPVVKFNGYPFELSKALRSTRLDRGHIPFIVRHTIDMQFNALLEKAESDGKITDNVLCALDTSGSMSCMVNGLRDVRCIDVATSLAIFFAKLNKGEFHDKVMMFDTKSRPYTLKGDGFTEIWQNLPSVGFGGTNFQSIVDELVKIRVSNPSIPVSEYPTTILVVSDMQFNMSGDKTNLDESVSRLASAFPQEYVDSVKWVWWDCTARYTDMQDDKPDDGRSFFFSGFDGSILTFLLNEEKNEEEKVEKQTVYDVINKALNQDVLKLVSDEDGRNKVIDNW